MEKKNNLKLGEILLYSDKISQKHLEEGMEKQRRHKRKLGEIFVMMGLLTPEELNLFLTLQKALSEIENQNVKIDLLLFQKVKTLGLLVKKIESEKNKIIPPKEIN